MLMVVIERDDFHSSQSMACAKCKNKTNALIILSYIFVLYNHLQINFGGKA